MKKLVALVAALSLWTGVALAGDFVNGTDFNGYVSSQPTNDFKIVEIQGASQYIAPIIQQVNAVYTSKQVSPITTWSSTYMINGVTTFTHGSRTHSHN